MSLLCIIGKNGAVCSKTISGSFKNDRLISFIEHELDALIQEKFALQIMRIFTKFY